MPTRLLLLACRPPGHCSRSRPPPRRRSTCRARCVVGLQERHGRPPSRDRRAGAVGARGAPRPARAPPRRSPTRCRTTSPTPSQFTPERPRPAPPVELHRHATASACRRPGRWPPRPGRRAAGASTVAVLDSGVAFERYRGFRRAPDLRRSTFVHPWDFVDHDRHPNDRYGHGTHVTGTIGRGDQQRQGRRGRGLRREDHAAPGARRLRRGRLGRDRPGDPLRGQARRRRDQPLARVRPARGRHRDPRDPVGDPLRARRAAS